MIDLRTLLKSSDTIEETRRRMRILYVTPLWEGLGDLAIGISSSARGMPAFCRPLQQLQAKGHTIDVVLGVDKIQQAKLQTDFLGNATKIFPLVWEPRGIARVTSLVRGARQITRVLRNGSYDLVYGHGAMGAIGCWVARRHGIPTGLRIYGVHKYAKEIETLPRWKFVCRYPLQYYSFRGRKKFLIVTDDGSRGDVMRDALAPDEDAYVFRLWRNGTEFNPATTPSPHKREPWLFCPGRIAPKKQQRLCVELLHRLHAIGHTNIRLVLAGHVTDKTYFTGLMQQVRELGLEASCEYVGTFDRQQMDHALSHCLAVLSFQRVSNLSNICIETLAAGAVLVAPDDGSLNGVIEDDVSGILVRDSAEGAVRIAKLIEHPDQLNRLGAKASQSARRNFPSWDERVQDELMLIENSLLRRQAA